MRTTYIREATSERVDLYLDVDDPRTLISMGFVNDGAGWEHVHTIPETRASVAAARAAMSRAARELIAVGYVKQS
jgi:hypothetical protein